MKINFILVYLIYFLWLGCQNKMTQQLVIVKWQNLSTGNTQIDSLYSRKTDDLVESKEVIFLIEKTLNNTREIIEDQDILSLKNKKYFLSNVEKYLVLNDSLFYIIIGEDSGNDYLSYPYELIYSKKYKKVLFKHTGSWFRLSEVNNDRNDKVQSINFEEVTKQILNTGLILQSSPPNPPPPH